MDKYDIMNSKFLNRQQPIPIIKENINLYIKAQSSDDIKVEIDKLKYIIQNDSNQSSYFIYSYLNSD